MTAVAGCLLAALTSAPSAATPRLVELSLVTAGFSALLRNPAAALLTAGMTWSVYLGFLVEHAGELRWHGGVDLLRLGALLAAALIGSARWPVAGLLSARSAAMPRAREEPGLGAVPGPLDDRVGATASPPGTFRRHLIATRPSGHAWRR
ncbi:MAG: hypothetical protein ACRDOO_20190 [Actinomadura sp.]